ncbi:MAG: tetratricopeptide repeat protein [Elusimicrobia bacterium]|nr:tetratricopeptide repeat protein [Elusimicrobiota bacterium]
MKTLPWLIYGVLFMAGLVYAVLASTERAYDRITLPQIFYLFYAFLCVVISTFARDILITATITTVPVALFLWLTLRAEPEHSVSLQAEAQKDLDAFRKAVADRPNDVIALEAVGDLYAKIGEHELARAWYQKLVAVYAANPAYQRLQISLEEKMHHIDVNPIAGTDPLMPYYLRACPRCDSVAFRSQFACQVCRGPFYAAERLWRAAVFNRFVERHEFVRMTAAGLIFLPFLFLCGTAAYLVLWAFWSLGFRTNAGQERAFQGERPGDWTRFLIRCGMIAALLAGFLAHSQGFKPGRPSRPSEPVARSGPASIRPSMPPQVKQALTEALARGDYDQVYPKGTPMRMALEEMAYANASPTLEKAMAEGQAAGLLDKPYSGGVTLRRVLEELNAGRSSPTLEKAVAEAEARGDLDKPFAGGVTFKQILNESRQGYAGPSIDKALAAAEANGDLDRIKVRGKTLREYRDEARELSRQADEKARRSEAAQSEALGVNVSPDDPRAVVAEMIPLLGRPEAEAQLHAVQTLCDIRIAANAEDAIPHLEPLARSTNPDVAEFAELALQRIRYCRSSALCMQKWRKK